MDRFLQRVLATIERYGMFSGRRQIGVAVSGGADSVCLLFTLRELSEQLGITLSVLHVDHGLRGEESAADALFVAALAGQLSLPLITERTHLGRLPGNLEQHARRARLDFFRRQIASGIVDCVAVGHTRSDQAETVLFRVLRGAASAGLAGIRPVTSEGIVRPLIEIERADVENFLNQGGISWREDSTNASARFARNRIRHGLLPQLAREWNPGITETLAHTAEWAAAEELWWDGQIAELASRYFDIRADAILVKAGDLAALPLAPARRLIRRAMELAKGDLRGIDFAHIEAVLRLARGGSGHGRVEARGLEIARSFDWVRFSRPSPNGRNTAAYAVPVTVPGIVEVPGSGLAISLEILDKAETSAMPEYVYNREMGCIDWPSVSGPLELRNWRPGDRYQPSGHTGEEKVKNLFQKHRVPLWERSGWPVLTDGSGIIWSRKFGPSAGLVPGKIAGPVLRIREIVNLESEMPARASIDIR